MVQLADTAQISGVHTAGVQDLGVQLNGVCLLRLPGAAAVQEHVPIIKELLPLLRLSGELVADGRYRS